MIRLALFSDTYLPQVNGVAHTLRRLVDAVAERGGVTRVFTTTDPASPTATDDAVRRYDSVPFWAYPQLRLAWPPRRGVLPELEAFRPTVVHTATPFGVGLAGRWGAQRLGVPLVTSYHTSFTAYAAHYGLGALAEGGWQFLRWFHNAGRRTYVPTRAVAAELRARGFTHLRTWGRGVDGGRFSPEFRSQELRRELGVGPDDVLAIYVGRLAPEKGLDVALDAMRRITSCVSGRRVVFALAGDGPHEARYRALAVDACIFMGRLSGRALSEFYASADLFVFPSTTDTFGNVLLEAMASGVPVIAADVPPARELVGPERGALFRADDPGDLADTLTRLAADHAERVRLGRGGRAFASGASWSNVFDGLIGDYGQVVEAHRGDRRTDRVPIDQRRVMETVA